MKKIMLSFGTMTAIAAPISAVVACNNDKDKDKDKNKEISVTDKARIALFDAITTTGGKYVAGTVASPLVPAVKDKFLGVELTTVAKVEPTTTAAKAAIMKMADVQAKITGMKTDAATSTSTTMTVDNAGTSIPAVTVANITFNTDFATTFDDDTKLASLYDAIAAASTNQYVVGTAEVAKGATTPEVKPTLAGVPLTTFDGGKLAKDFTDAEKIAAIKTIKAKITLAVANTDNTKTDFTVDGTVFTVDKVTFNKDVKTTLGL